MTAEPGHSGSIEEDDAVVSENLRQAPPDPAPETADVGRAIRWAVRATAHEFRRRARLVHPPASVPPVRADEARLRQVFVNLLKNAAEAVPPGRIAEHEVAIAARLEHGHVLVEVRDDGCGIAPEHLARIFEPFFTTRPVGEGTGLGLAVCREIVSALGGEIQVQSQVGRGATFCVVLPVAGDTGQRGHGLDPAPVPARILIVDPDAMIHRTMRRLLRDHEVVCVTGAPDALARVDHGERFDIILTELLMPVMTGIELYHRVRARDPEAARRVVFVTSGVHATPGAEQFLRSISSSNLTLEKPFGQTELDSVVTLMLADRLAG